MSCSPFDLRDYYFKDLAENDRRVTEVHVRACAGCREELDRLRCAETALLALRDEEIPQRIGFVSDPVFGPSGLSRAWTVFWGSAARLGFASAAMLSASLLVFSLTRPAPQSGAPAPASARITADANWSKQVNDAVTQAVADSERRQLYKTEELLQASDRRHALETQAMQARLDDFIEVERKHRNTQVLASNEPAGEKEAAQ